MIQQPFTAASLFTGLGGFDIAADEMDWETLFQCEIDPFCRQILNHYWPNATLYNDITTTDFRFWRHKVDILTGGFPCQPFSLAGNRKGTTDDRHLWPQMRRAIKEIMPPWVIAENVAGITSMVFPTGKTQVETQHRTGGKDHYRSVERETVINRICKDFEEMGYEVTPFIIPAAGVNAPHKRDRCWFIAYSNDGFCKRANYKLRTRRPAAYRRSTVTTYSSNTRLEAMRQRPKQTNRFEFTSYTNNNWPRRLQNTSSKARAFQGHDLPRGKRRISNGKRIVTNAINHGSPYRCKKASRTQHGSKSRRLQQLEGKGSRNVANPNGQRFQKYNLTTITSQKARQHCRTHYKNGSNNWRDFPTESPICGRNDGIPDGLDGITFSKWRRETIKGYGNAVVPLEVLELFKMIEEINNLKL
ncbi:DNA cytosine methyltransferase [Nonlabens agnitus]|uniref:Cytosine-specific methyltransferase n=1 Tax=Nonlabens agnitus TaxID=870484 RepID=A0A2S9WXC0_9FLAO|nr:DNA (cytosine-5-)-methyltransferase [Nonlabens agnitus]PRP68122.1 hypothetical protein BST86_14005 [Nonlabens agnitus]